MEFDKGQEALSFGLETSYLPSEEPVALALPVEDQPLGKCAHPLSFAEDNVISMWIHRPSL